MHLIGKKARETGKGTKSCFSSLLFLFCFSQFTSKLKICDYQLLIKYLVRLAKFNKPQIKRQVNVFSYI